MDSELSNNDICRVCRSEGLPDRPLFHPCICTGSIKWIHQECLVQWMKYSHKEYCELCGHRFSFTPIYSPDMPRRLPIKDLLSGIFSSILTAVKYWFHYTLVALAWMGIVPLTACRIYRALFKGTVDGILLLPFDMLSTENVTADTFQGCFVVICTLFAFAGLVWLREQIIHGGGPEWMQREEEDVRVRLAPLNNNEAEPLAVVPEQDIAELEAVPPVPENPEFPEDAELNANEDNNWIPMEWDRAAEEITWERLLGLDGSLKFIEHVFWVISLNTLFIIIFAYSPYHMGVWTLHISNMTEYASASHFEGLLTTLIGYCSVGVLFLFFHQIAQFLGCQKAKRVLGLGYIFVKVSLLSVVEIGVLPLICGWWLDICSLSMFDATLKDRENSFLAAPGTSVFIHWLIGMVYVYYFASFVLLMRETLRPGVLWFLKNFNDPDFSPVQEMIHLPIMLHVRKLLISGIVFGSAILLSLWLPIRIIKWCLPNFLPYSVYLNNGTQVNELSLELMLLQVILPALLEQSHTRIWLKSAMRNWCRAVSWILGIHSYLLGENDGVMNRDNVNEQNNANNIQDGGVGAAHQALFMMEQPTGFQPYTRPSFFMARLFGLLVCICLSLVVISVIALTVPVWVGRKVMVVWLAEGPTYVTLAGKTTNQTQLTEVKVHELYTAACGLYVGWMTTRAVCLVLSWLPQGRAAMGERLKQWCILGIKTIVASFLLLWVIPLMFGLLFELVVIVPLSVPIHQSPILFIWQDWALGVLYTKIACALTMMGPEWFLRNAIEQAYRDGIRQMHLRMIIENLALPVIVCFGLFLSVPYIIAYSIVPLFVSSFQLKNLIARRIYPFLLLMILTVVFISFQVKQFRNLYEHIKNDKYLVGQRLVNYDHEKKSTSTT